ncbi:MAG: hypothetical protein M1834_004585 [Cirrosporium novae-zelandiae]|nr:MAG: hypothetical protein M1834_004585 [Cirrosporium novae-zelandiae]
MERRVSQKRKMDDGAKTSPSKKPRSFTNLFDSVVQIKVGPKGELFEVHKGLLLHYSGYFKCALSGRFKEAHENIIVLETEDVAIFELFFTWIYKDAIAKQEKQLPLALGIECNTPNNLMGLYAFADGRRIPRLCNAVAVMIRDNQKILSHQDKLTFFTECVSQIRKELPLRQLLIDLCVYADTLLGWRPANHPNDFVTDVFNSLYAKWMADAGKDRVLKIMHSVWKNGKVNDSSLSRFKGVAPFEEKITQYFLPETN